MGWVREFFVEHGRLFERVMEGLLEEGAEEARLVSGLLERHGVPRGGRVLELGCGIGRVAVPLAREGYRVTCLDISERYVARAREYAESLGVADRFEAVAGDAWRVDDLVSPGFDAVMLIWTTLIGYRESREHDIDLLRRAWKIARGGGKLLILRQAHRDLIVARAAQCGEGPFLKPGEDFIVVENPRFDPVTSILENTWAYYEKRGWELRLLGEASFRLRIYTPTELVAIAGEAGWELEALYGNLRGDPFRVGRSGFNGVFRKRGRGAPGLSSS